MGHKERIGDILVANQQTPRAVAENAAVETGLADAQVLSVLVDDGHLDTRAALAALAEQVTPSAKHREQFRQHIVSIL